MADTEQKIAELKRREEEEIEKCKLKFAEWLRDECTIDMIAYAMIQGQKFGAAALNPREDEKQRLMYVCLADNLKSIGSSDFLLKVREEKIARIRAKYGANRAVEATVDQGATRSRDSGGEARRRVGL